MNDEKLIWEAYVKRHNKPINIEIITENNFLKRVAPYALGAASMLGIGANAQASDGAKMKEYPIQYQTMSHTAGANVKDINKASEAPKIGQELPAAFVQVKEKSILETIVKGSQTSIRDIHVSAIKSTQLDNGLVSVVFEVLGEVTASSQEEANKIAADLIQKSFNQEQKQKDSPIQIKVRLENVNASFKVKVYLDATYRKQ